MAARRKLAGRRRAAPVQKTPLLTPARIRNSMSLVALGLLSFSLWQLPVWLQQARMFPVQNVTVKGSFVQLEPQQIYALVNDMAAGDFFEVPVEKIRATVQSMPWVNRVSVRRQWPDTVVIWVQEQKAVAHWNDDAMLNADGEIFHPQKDRVALDLPRLRGHRNSERLVLEKYRLFQQELAVIGQGADQLLLDERRAWSLTLDNGVVLSMGRYADADRVQRYVQYYEKLFADQSGRIRELDLRYSNGISVRWKEGDEEFAQGMKDVTKS